MRMVAGKRYFGEDEGDEEAKRFREIMEEAMLLGFEKKFVRLGKNMDEFLQGLIEEHRRDHSRNAMISHLLSLQQSQPEYYADQIIKGLIM
ncbi:unnamed protein product, partial [Ilex paraguariensis]